MAKFIYVFDELAYAKLTSEKYKLVKADFNKNIYVFFNDGEHESRKFSSQDFKFVLSNTLTF